MGYSVERDVGILRAFRDGVVRNASLLVIGASAASAVRLALDAGLCVGLHLNLTEGSPCAGRSDVESLLAPPDCKFFRGKMGLRDALARGDVRADHVAAEVEAQFDRFRALHPTGAGPAYVDGHQHVHVLPLVVATLCRPLQQGRIPAVRIPELGPAEAAAASADLPPARHAFYEAVSADCAAARAAFAGAGAASPPAFLGYTTMGADCSVARVLGVLARLVEAVPAAAEWMTHPGLRTVAPPRPPDAGGAGCGDGPDDFALSPERERELAVLCDPALAAGIAAAGWAPAAFSEMWPQLPPLPP